MIEPNHEKRIEMLERLVKALDRMYCVLLVATLIVLGAIVTIIWE